ncbi:hypothetical protein O1611_g4549 [Lasiodiplodia mahajangana]|uniref:Uncharacterized protein n=1 Tax=Lasiodiplodia mahajangana TaxID=1108764 RepID=A0ACC2JNS6_9PEZI|nr:hypothetical protein O1611_g4549 [Lasiodiplodia mahajangana]
MPKFPSPLIEGVMGRYLKSQKIIFDELLPVAEQRCRERDLAKLGHKVPKHADYIQWIMEMVPRQKPWTAKQAVHELMAIWFGPVHALSTTSRTSTMAQNSLLATGLAPLRLPAAQPVQNNRPKPFMACLGHWAYGVQKYLRAGGATQGRDTTYYLARENGKDKPRRKESRISCPINYTAYGD